MKALNNLRGDPGPFVDREIENFSKQIICGASHDRNRNILPPKRGSADRVRHIDDSSETFADQQNPVADQQNPFADQQNPLADQQNPVADQQNPLADQQNPVADQPASDIDKQKLVDVEPNPEPPELPKTKTPPKIGGVFD
ncbi:MAG TPA: hypothetical protein VHY33_01350 [Thermoanaerobaculia bacterium]|nr:hypothetical protein [Thermoanaerobaculia bacterium]